MKPKRLKKNYHKLSVVHCMLIVEIGETVASTRVYTRCDVTRSYFGTSPWKTKRSSKKIFSRPEMLLRLENYESVDHRLRFPGIKILVIFFGYIPVRDCNNYQEMSLARRNITQYLPSQQRQISSDPLQISPKL